MTTIADVDDESYYLNKLNKTETIETCPKTLTWKEPDYSKMYFEFQFKDGEKATYRMDKDCHNLQQFLDRMNHFHDLEKENKRLQEQLRIATKALKKMAKDNFQCAEQALEEIELRNILIPSKSMELKRR